MASVKCPYCGKPQNVVITPKTQVEGRMGFEALHTPEERNAFMASICTKCWSEIMGAIAEGETSDAEARA